MKKSNLKSKLQLFSHLMILFATFALLLKLAQPQIDQQESLTNTGSFDIQALAALDPFYAKNRGYKNPPTSDPYEHLELRSLLNVEMVESITGYDRYQLFDSYERLRSALEGTATSIWHSSIWLSNRSTAAS